MCWNFLSSCYGGRILNHAQSSGFLCGNFLEKWKLIRKTQKFYCRNYNSRSRYCTFNQKRISRIVCFKFLIRLASFKENSDGNLLCNKQWNLIGNFRKYLLTNQLNVVWNFSNGLKITAIFLASSRVVVEVTHNLLDFNENFPLKIRDGKSKSTWHQNWRKIMSSSLLSTVASSWAIRC